MLPRKIILSLRAGFLAGAMILAAGALAQTGNSLFPGTNPAPALTITLQPGELVGHEQIIRALLKSGTNQFLFVVPDGLRIQDSGGGVIVMSSRDMKYYASVRLVEPPPPDLELKEALREQIARQYPGASGLEEFAGAAANREGTGVQLRQEMPGVAPRQIRILWVPFKAGLMEFALVGVSDKFPAARGAFDIILLTFRSNEHGKLEFVRHSDKT